MTSKDRIRIERVSLAVSKSNRRDGDKLVERYAIEKAHWIWHPEDRGSEAAVCQFRLFFEAVSGEPVLKLHVSADQQYELYLDGELFSRGPEAGDVEHWPFASFTLDGLIPGKRHCLEARVWWIGDSAPTARMTFRKGFILKAEGSYAAMLTTGLAPWEVQLKSGFSCTTRSIFACASTTTDLRLWDTGFYLPASIISPGLESGAYRRRLLMGAPWQLTPARLGEQCHKEWSGGRVRAVLHTLCGGNFSVSAAAGSDASIPAWQMLLSEGQALVVPPKTVLSVIWDLNDYVCGYPLVGVSGGEGASFSINWAESLYESANNEDLRFKGNRSEVLGKTFLGAYGDTFHLNGAVNSILKPIWWRSGRFCVLAIETREDPLTIDSLRILETHYGIEMESHFDAPIERLAPIVSLCLRSLQACSHDIYLDCPYYEQRMFVGDSLVEALISYTVMRDARLSRRSIELFDFSRAVNSAGFTTARYPCREATGISTFSMLWIWMIHDYYYWRDDPSFVSDCLIGMRSVLNALSSYRGEDHLLANLPGRSFVDWAFPQGDPPGAFQSRSSIVNLTYLITLTKAIELEEAVGHSAMASFYRDQHASTLEMTRKVFWNSGRGCFMDDPSHECLSEHALVLSLLAGILNEQETESTAEVLFHADDRTRCTPYFKHFLFEAHYRLGRGDRILESFDDWRGFLDLGLKASPEENPEQTRSDCHAWSAHPLFHLTASISGIRPAAPGFREIVVAPSPGELPQLHARMPHPQGVIDCKLSFKHGCRGSIALPGSTIGIFSWHGEILALAPGWNEIELPSDGHQGV